MECSRDRVLLTDYTILMAGDGCGLTPGLPIHLTLLTPASDINSPIMRREERVKTEK